MLNLLKINFTLLGGVFVIFLGFLFVPAVTEALGPLFLVLIAIFILLGGSLTFLSLKTKLHPKTKRFLLLTGVSAVGFTLFSLLHNFFYAMGVVTQEIFILHQLFEILHVVSFLISIIVCPIGFIVGILGSLYLFFLYNKRKEDF